MDKISEKELRDVVKWLNTVDRDGRDELLRDLLVGAYPTLTIQNS